MTEKLYITRVDYVIKRCPECCMLSRWYDEQCQYCLRQRQARTRSTIIVVVCIIIFVCAVYRTWSGL